MDSRHAVDLIIDLVMSHEPGEIPLVPTAGLTNIALAARKEPRIVERIAALGTGPALFEVELLEFFGETYQEAQGFESPPVHDSCAVAYVIDPSIVLTVRVPIDIELAGALTLGMTVADFRPPAPADCTTFASTTLDREQFGDLVVDALENIGKVTL